MSISWNLPTENLYQTLAGFFSPNRTPASFIDTLMPPEVIFAHETEHRSLSMATTVGKYQTALAFAAVHNKSNKKKCEESYRYLVDLCWFTHEGVATALHTLKAQELGGISYANELNARLPTSYKKALGRFINIISAEQLEKTKPSTVDKDQFKVEVFSNYGEAFRILALAAMSTPISKILDEQNTLPSHKILVAVRKDAPDNRLLKLLNHVTDKFVLKCNQVIREAHKSASVELKSAPIDAARIELARDLCKASNIGFEECHAIEDISMLKKMGVTDVKNIDGRETPLEHRVVMDSISVAVQADYEKLNPIEMDYILNLHSHAFIQQFKINPDIICEIFPYEKGFIIVIHCFCNKIQMERIIKNDTQMSQKYQKMDSLHKADDDSAFLLLRYSTFLSHSSLLKLPNNLICNSFSWFVPEWTVQTTGTESRVMEITYLKNLGAVFIPAANTNLWGAKFESIKSISERPECAGPEINIKTSSTHSLLSYDKSIPENLELLTFHVDGSLERYILPVIIGIINKPVIAQYGRINLSKGSYLDSCVCHALLNGEYGRYITSKMGGLKL